MNGRHLHPSVDPTRPITAWLDQTCSRCQHHPSLHGPAGCAWCGCRPGRNPAGIIVAVALSAAMWAGMIYVICAVWQVVR